MKAGLLCKTRMNHTLLDTHPTDSFIQSFTPFEIPHVVSSVVIIKNWIARRSAVDIQSRVHTAKPSRMKLRRRDMTDSVSDASDDRLASTDTYVVHARFERSKHSDWLSGRGAGCYGATSERYLVVFICGVTIVKNLQAATT